MNLRYLAIIGTLVCWIAAAHGERVVSEFRLTWPDTGITVPSGLQPVARGNQATSEGGSTHELAFDRQNGTVFWVTGQAYDAIARVRLDGSAAFFPMPTGSAPHGVAFDTLNQLWVTFEGLGEVARVDADGHVVQRVDVRLHAEGASEPINTHPHGLAVGPDGRTLWFTGKLTNSVGRIGPDGHVAHFVLPTVGAVPIYLEAGPDGNMWCTELIGNRIARITPDGLVTEWAIPTVNSRPIAIVRGADEQSMWFSQEAGNKVARIGMDGQIREFPVPMPQADVILGGLAFDVHGNLWTQSYVSPLAPGPHGNDYVVMLGAAISNAAAGNLSGIPLSYYRVPSRSTVMHRIVAGPDGNIWFTELALDRIGRIAMPP